MLNPELIRIGTSSFSETDWVGPFYPPGARPGDFLPLYARKFSTVEIDATYYAIPSKSTVDSWVRKTLDNFLIAAKFPRSIVHGGEGPRPDPEIVLVPEATYAQRDIFLDIISRLGSRLGPLLIQFPYFSRTAFKTATEFFARLDKFLSDLPEDFRYAVEIRNRNWLTEEYVALLKKHKVALTLVDQAWMPHGDEIEPRFDPVTTDFVYIRLLGDRKEIEAITQSWDKEVIDRQDRLERWARLALRIQERRIKSLIYVNNHFAGHAPTTARRLEKMIIEMNL
ncbi:MAG: DUF72 domain-containing protein [candidate division Zixibacteria bacterium]|nr:DUF72 domain-containing protein [candidate division Zixibacteria bacterium]